MPMFRITTAGPVIYRKDNLSNVQKFVERHVPMKRNWIGEWAAASNGQVHIYAVQNSKGRIVNTVRVSVVDI